MCVATSLKIYDIPVKNRLANATINRIRIIRRLGFPDETSVLETCQEHYQICQRLFSRKPKLTREAIIKHIRKS